jgi:hypothetical protein
VSFPKTARDLAVELFLAGGWMDITNDVLTRDKIRITRGRPNEASNIPPSTLNLTLNNRFGRYSPRNPTGPYYGTFGRNTPVRVAVRTERDTFTRTVSGGWGSSDTGGAWTTDGNASQFSVSGGVGKMSVAGSATFDYAFLGGSVYRDVDVSATVTMPFATVLGGNVEPAILMASGLTYNDYFMAQTAVSPAGAVSVQIVHLDATVVAPSVTVSGLTYTGQALKARFQVEGQTLRAKIWDGTLPEPYAWTVEGRTDRLAGRAAGWVGIRSGVSVGNTNTLPIVFSYDNLEVRSNRFAGEVSFWPQQWDITGADVYTPIQAAGILRRLGQGKSALKSTYRRGNETLSPRPLVYFPVEEGNAATSIASGIVGSPMIVDGPTQFAANSDFVGSAPIAKVNGASWAAAVRGAPNTGVIQTIFLLSVPSTGETAEAALIRVNSSGSAPFWDLIYTVGGGFRVKVYDANSALIIDSGPIVFNLDGRPVQVALGLTQNGANVDWSLTTLKPGDPAGTAASGTVTGRTVGALTGIIVSPYKQVTGSAIGHIMARNYSLSIFNLGSQLAAYAGETAASRIVRLCAENNIPTSDIWNGKITSARLGPQRRDTLLNLLTETVAADMGDLYESRSTLGLVFRARSSLYNQTPALALDYSAGHISPPFQPVDDDQALRNDVTVTRTNGSSSQATQTTGPLAVTNPASGNGVGRYDAAVTLNLAGDVQVPDAATWLLHMGTVDEARYPTIPINLTKLAGKYSAALDRAALSVDIDDRVTIDNPPKWMDPAKISQIARGYTEEIVGGFIHTLTFNASPESPYQVLVLDSPSLGKIDSSSSTVAAPGLTTTGTSLIVASTAELWTTDPAQMPIPITVAGEDMTVTAITSATSPQTFTVTRSVNGVVKTHSAGEQVHLTRDATIAL